MKQTLFNFTKNVHSNIAHKLHETDFAKIKIKIYNQ